MAADCDRMLHGIQIRGPVTALMLTGVVISRIYLFGFESDSDRRLIGMKLQSARI